MAENEVKMLFLEVLNQLTQEDFSTFRWHLGLQMQSIPAYKLERADRLETVDLMVQHQPQEAVDVTIETFRAIGRNDLAQYVASNNIIGLR